MPTPLQITDSRIYTTENRANKIININNVLKETHKILVTYIRIRTNFKT